MNCNRCGFTACSCIGIIISIIFSVIIGLLFAFGFIPGIVISTWIAFGLSILTLIFLMLLVLTNAAKPSEALKKCLCNNTACLLTGIFGTIISSLAALSIVLTPEFISVIVLVAIGAFFFMLMIIGLIAIISCIVCNFCSNHQEHTRP